MYNRPLTETEKDAIRRGDIPTLIKVLEDVDEKLIASLKYHKGDVRFQQGASSIVDYLLALLKNA